MASNSAIDSLRGLAVSGVARIEVGFDPELFCGVFEANWFNKLGSGLGCAARSVSRIESRFNGRCFEAGLFAVVLLMTLILGGVETLRN